MATIVGLILKNLNYGVFETKQSTKMHNISNSSIFSMKN